MGHAFSLHLQSRQKRDLSFCNGWFVLACLEHDFMFLESLLGAWSLDEYLAEAIVAYFWPFCGIFFSSFFSFNKEPMFTQGQLLEKRSLNGGGTLSTRSSTSPSVKRIPLAMAFHEVSLLAKPPFPFSYGTYQSKSPTAHYASLDPIKVMMGMPVTSMETHVSRDVSSLTYECSSWPATKR